MNFISNSHDFLTSEQAFFDPEYLLLTTYKRTWYSRGGEGKRYDWKVLASPYRSFGRDIAY
jgi:hypothetical protein